MPGFSQADSRQALQSPVPVIGVHRAATGAAPEFARRSARATSRCRRYQMWRECLESGMLAATGGALRSSCIQQLTKLALPYTKSPRNKTESRKKDPHLGCRKIAIFLIVSESSGTCTVVRIALDYPTHISEKTPMCCKDGRKHAYRAQNRTSATWSREGLGFSRDSKHEDGS